MRRTLSKISQGAGCRRQQLQFLHVSHTLWRKTTVLCSVSYCGRWMFLWFGRPAWRWRLRRVSMSCFCSAASQILTAKRDAQCTAACRRPCSVDDISAAAAADVALARRPRRCSNDVRQRWSVPTQRSSSQPSSSSSSSSSRFGHVLRSQTW